MPTLHEAAGTISHYYYQAGAWQQWQWLILCVIVFIPLAYFFPSKKGQPLFRKDMVWADAFYWFCGGLIYGPIVGILITFFATSIYKPDTLSILGRQALPLFANVNVWLQALIILVIMDFMQYWTHRLFHQNGFWEFHAIHHSPVEVDWMSSARFHPVNILVHSSMVYSVVFLLGFNPEAWLILGPFNAFYSPLVHANVNWTYGPFRHVLASPVFHRWHHTSIHEGGNKNFAPTFPVLDIIFGTYYDPKDARPTVFGVTGNVVPQNILGQLIYPFRRSAKISQD